MPRSSWSTTNTKSKHSCSHQWEREDQPRAATTWFPSIQIETKPTTRPPCVCGTGPKAPVFKNWHCLNSTRRNSCKRIWISLLNLTRVALCSLCCSRQQPATEYQCGHSHDTVVLIWLRTQTSITKLAALQCRSWKLSRQVLLIKQPWSTWINHSVSWL